MTIKSDTKRTQLKVNVHTEFRPSDLVDDDSESIIKKMEYRLPTPLEVRHQIEKVGDCNIRKKGES